MDLCLATAYAGLLGFSGFNSMSSLVLARPCHFVVSQEMMRMQIIQSKTNHLRQGDECIIARTGNCTCPVTMHAGEIYGKDRHVLGRPQILILTHLEK